MSSQFTTTFTRFAVTSAIMIGRTTFMACRYRRSAAYRRSGRVLQVTIRRYGAVISSTVGCRPHEGMRCTSSQASGHHGHRGDHGEIQAVEQPRWHSSSLPAP